MEEYRDIWYSVALYVTNWSSFTQVCKLFYSLKDCLSRQKYNIPASIINHFTGINWDYLYEVMCPMLDNEEYLLLAQALGKPIEEPFKAVYEDDSVRFIQSVSLDDAIVLVEKALEQGVLDKKVMGPLIQALIGRDDVGVEFIKTLSPKARMILGYDIINDAKVPIEDAIYWSKRLGGLSCENNPNLTLDTLKAHPEHPWDMSAVISAIPLDQETVEYLMSFVEEEHEDNIAFMLSCLSCNKTVTYPLIKPYLKTSSLDIESLVTSKNLTYHDIKELDSDVSWDCEAWNLAILVNPNLTLNQVISLLKY